jgi:hypothetical protein
VNEATHVEVETCRRAAMAAIPFSCATLAWALHLSLGSSQTPIIHLSMYATARFRCVNVVGVKNSDQSVGGGVVKVGVTSFEDGDNTSCISLDGDGGCYTSFCGGVWTI